MIDVMFSNLRYVQRQLKKGTPKDWKIVSKQSDVPFGTIKRIAYGETKNPLSITVDKLAAHFRTKERRAA